MRAFLAMDDEIRVPVEATLEEEMEINDIDIIEELVVDIDPPNQAGPVLQKISRYKEEMRWLNLLQQST